MEPPTDADRPFGVFLGAWAVTAGLACVLGPWALGEILHKWQPFPFGSYVSLVFASLTLVLFGFCIVNLIRRATNQPSVELVLPASFTPWLIGAAPVLIGVLIGFTVWR
jgi:hypothetical protein